MLLSVSFGDFFLVLSKSAVCVSHERQESGTPTDTQRGNMGAEALLIDFSHQHYNPFQTDVLSKITGFTGHKIWLPRTESFGFDNKSSDSTQGGLSVNHQLLPFPLFPDILCFTTYRQA